MFCNRNNKFLRQSLTVFLSEKFRFVEKAIPIQTSQNKNNIENNANK